MSRRALAASIVAGVAIVHGCIAEQAAERLAEMHLVEPMPARVEVAYVRELDVTPPPAVAPVPAPPRPPRAKKRRAPREPQAAASASVITPPQERVVQAEEAAASRPTEPLAADREPTPPAPQPDSDAVRDAATAANAAGAASAPSATASAPVFSWPASTRVTYVLTGNYRGEIHGRAQVQWARLESAYQVDLDVTVGLPFAPLYTRRITSAGRITPDGLRPERYDEETHLALHDRQRAGIVFDGDRVVLRGNRIHDAPDGVQDAASQFIQLTYLFTTQPALLAPGRVIDVPLALPREVSHWLYDVQPPETLATPFGAIEAVGLKPRRLPRAGGDPVPEMWFAPSLAYLPVRILIHQDADTFIDLVIQRKPELAAQ